VCLSESRLEYRSEALNSAVAMQPAINVMRAGWRRRTGGRGGAIILAACVRASERVTSLLRSPNITTTINLHLMVFVN
jgi:hypothetical protein